MTTMGNRLYPDKYGSWAGNTAGQKPDYERCCEEVGRDQGGRTSFGQCSRKRGFGPDKAYCKTHDPATVADRRKAADEAYNIKTNAQRYGWHGRKFYKVLEQIAAGHNDARGLAQETIDEFMKGMK